MTRPLDVVGSIKTRLGLLVAASVVAAVLLSLLGSAAGVPAGAIFSWAAAGAANAARDASTRADRRMRIIEQGSGLRRKDEVQRHVSHDRPGTIGQR